MSSEAVACVIMTGLVNTSRPEKILSRSLEAATLDLVRKASNVNPIESIVLSTNSRSLRSKATSQNSTLIPDDSTPESKEFHFGEQLKRIVDNHNLTRVLYFGGGSGVLLEEADIEALANFVIDHPNTSISNNFYSTDFIGLNPVGKALSFGLPYRDNELGWKSRRAGMIPFELVRNAKTQFDIDTPIDLCSLSVTNSARGELSDYVASLSLPTSPFRNLMKQLVNPDTRILIVGRVSASTWSYLESHSACQVDVLSEGRGACSSHRTGRGEFCSFLAAFSQLSSPERLFDTMLSSRSAVIMDSRVLFWHAGIAPSPQDRYWSDLRRPEMIQNPYTKELTEAARNTEQRVMLGGHSLVSGSMYLLVDAAWENTGSEEVPVRPKKSFLLPT